jgi:hypothetical protein
MIICGNLGRAGRLGNQLWQIASTLGIAHDRLDTVSFPAWDYQPYFSVPAELFAGAQGTEASTLVPHLPDMAKPYLQDYYLFQAIENQIKEYFRPSPLARETLDVFEEFYALPKPILSVHVRRGDNVPGADPGVVDKYLYHPMPANHYYARAIHLYQGQYASTVCFSDDVEWCYSNIKADYYHRGTPRAKEHTPEYADPFQDWIDLFLMAECQHHVLSNSTYGWWGAFLSGDLKPIVPKPWFGPRIDADSDLMFPLTWRQVGREPQC